MSASQQAGVTTTSANILEEACSHLIRVDSRMEPLIKAHHCRMFSADGLAERIDPFESLASGIISSRVSGAAANSIKRRFVALFSDDGDEAGDGERGRRRGTMAAGASRTRRRLRPPASRRCARRGSRSARPSISRGWRQSSRPAS